MKCVNAGGTPDCLRRVPVALGRAELVLGVPRASYLKALSRSVFLLQASAFIGTEKSYRLFRAITLWGPRGAICADMRIRVNFVPN